MPEVGQRRLSPSSKQPSSSPLTEPVPLDAAIRTTPIHPLLPDVRVPGDPSAVYEFHPVTCAPINFDELRTQLQQLRKEYPTEAAALKAQEQTARELERKMQDAKRKRESIQKEMDKKQKERDTELKVLAKQAKLSGIAS